MGRFYFYMQTLQTMSIGCSIWSFFVFGLLVHEKNSFKCTSLYNPTCT